MRPTAGTSTTEPRGDGAHDETQGARSSANQALPGLVTDAPSAPSGGLYGQDGGKTEHESTADYVCLSCGVGVGPLTAYQADVERLDGHNLRAVPRT